MKDLTIIYYSANLNSEHFMQNTQKCLLDAVGDTPIIAVTFKPTQIGQNCMNICIGDQPRSNYMIYKQVLLGVQAAKTEYVAMAEDDMLYSKDHFSYRPPTKDMFSYNINKWSIFSWIEPPVFSYRVRKLMNSLICSREALQKTLEQRYVKYPTLEDVPEKILDLYWGEPGRFENHLGIDPVNSEEFSSEVPNIMFSTSEALGYQKLGSRKAHSDIRTDKVDPWGTAQEVLDLYA